MQPLKLLFLSQSDVINAGGKDMKAAMKDVELAFSLFDRGDCVLPFKTSLRWGDDASEIQRGRINSMPGYVGGSVSIAGIKWLGGSPQNPFRFGIPRAAGILVLNDPVTLAPIAIMEGALISAMRTGAVSGMGAKYLANPASRVLGLIGAGVQGRTQLLALREALPNIREVRVFDKDAVRMEQFAVQMSETLGIDVRPAVNAQECVEGADVFVTAVVTNVPVVHDGWAKAGSLYVHIGSHECDFDVIAHAEKVVVDSWDAVVHRDATTISKMHAAGLFGRENLYAEIGEIINKKKCGRTEEHERIVFAPIGFSLHDLVMGARLYREARRQKLGTELTLYDEPVFA
jgi:N-[(2S)-2-amino-2-carboxyethyl]-L-glutamate dehydrogenase